jgi:4-amino-4-deoxy-L-arabinose transferase-like glycosyltransferase
MDLVMQNPPGNAYFIAAARSLFGWQERALHAVYLVPALAAALGTYRLARRLCRTGGAECATGSAVVGALCAVLTPAFIVSATTSWPTW